MRAFPWASVVTLFLPDTWNIPSGVGASFSHSRLFSTSIELKLIPFSLAADSYLLTFPQKINNFYVIYSRNRNFHFTIRNERREFEDPVECGFSYFYIGARIASIIISNSAKIFVVYKTAMDFQS